MSAPADCDGAPLTSAPALSLLGVGVAVVTAGEITWLDTDPPAVVAAGAAWGADCVVLAVTAGTLSTTVWVAVVAAGTTGAGEVVLSAEDADGPSVGKLGSCRVGEAVAP